MTTSTKQFFLGILILILFLTAEIVGVLLLTDTNSSTHQPEQTSVPLQQKSVDIKSTPTELPLGGNTVLPTYRFVALYGNPLYPALGSLGEQDINKAAKRVKKLAKQYQEYSSEKIYPTFEIITTVASSEPTSNNDYSREIDIKKISSWVRTAKEQGIYVVLDLQSGRSTFYEQAKLYKSILKEPHVGLALDPEWRLQSKQDRHLKKVGSVSASEIQKTADWLAELVKDNQLPQKIFMLHQFKTAMITNREDLDTTQPELGWVIHMDGHGTPQQKLETWKTIRRNTPENIYWGWKNFYDEDAPTLSPKQTTDIVPQPYFISYQ